MKVSHLFVYPIKSTRAIETYTQTFDACGFKYDRRFMIVDAQHRFCTQREFPLLACVSTHIEEQNLIVMAPNMPDLIVPLEPHDHSQVLVRIWNDDCEANAMSQESARWFSQVLQTSCSLVYLPTSKARTPDLNYAKSTDRVAFADGFPFLLTSTASLQALNQKLSQPVSMHRFRPNIVIDGAEPFAEDRWRVLAINGVLFRVVKPCSRCVIVNVNTTSGLRELEPLRTLSTFRKVHNKVYFGQNLIHNNAGTISIGDDVQVVEQNEMVTFIVPNEVH